MHLANVGRRLFRAALSLATIAAPSSMLHAASAPPNTNAFPQRYGVFEEPLVAAEPATPGQVRALDRVIAAYRRKNDAGNTQVIEAFLQTPSAQPWRASLWLNVGLAEERVGMYSDAMRGFERASREASHEPTVAERAVGQRALAELLLLNTKLGHRERAEAMVRQYPREQQDGMLASPLEIARQSLDDMARHPETAFDCGWLALTTLWHTQGVPLTSHLTPSIPGSAAGYSMRDLIRIARAAGHPLLALHASRAAPVPIPSVVHLRSGHFATVVATHDQRYHVIDNAMGRDYWATQRELDAEVSGDYLVSADTHLASAWHTLSPREAARIRGAGISQGPDPNGGTAPPPICNKCGSSPSPGMPQYSITSMLVGLVLNDTPLSYKPPVGPKIDIHFTYNQQDPAQPATFSYSNMGPKWTHNWLSYVTDDPANAGTNVQVYLPGGYARFYTGYNSATESFANEPQTGAVLVLTSTSPVTYERRMPDGSKDVYSASDNSTYYPRHIYWTQHFDPQGNAVTLAYDNTNRLTSLTDAIGQTTTFDYTSTLSPLLITGVTDPFGRTTALSYDSAGRLQSITDAVGMVSSFGYDTGTFINTLTTPYGTTAFSYADQNTYVGGSPSYNRAISVTDVMGHTSVIESTDAPTGIMSSDPTGIPVKQKDGNTYMNYRNTYFWDAYVNSLYPGDFTKARIMHFAHELGGLPAEYGQPAESLAKSEELESELYPLENRVWMDYPGMQPYFNGTYYKPNSTARILADGSSATSLHQYNNSFDKETLATDAISTVNGVDGRYLETDSIYAPNGIDLTEVDRFERNSTSSTPYSSTETWGSYNNQHEAQSYVDEDGQTWSYIYNARGQKISETDPLNHTKSWSYDSNGYLKQYSDENGNVTNYTYDNVGRLATKTDAGGYTTSYGYDDLDRLIKTTYWDGSYEQDTYTNLDITAHRDRLGQVTQYQYDGVRNLTQVTDPLGGITRYTYYPNDELETKVDAIGGTTTWVRDIEGRVTERDDPSGLATGYVYDLTNRLIEQDQGIHGTLGVVEKTLYDYDADNRVIGVTDPNGVYTAMAYHVRGWLQSRSVLANGKGQTSPNDATTSMAYSPRGELLAITDPDNYTQTYGYDAAHRRDSITDALGDQLLFTLDGVGNRLSESTYAPGSTTASRTHSTAYNGLNEPVQSIDGKGATTTYAYDGDRNVTDVVDPQGIITHSTYDALDRAKTVTQNYNGTSPATANKTTTYGYDADSHLTLVTDPDALQTGYQVDYLGHVTQLTSPDTGVTHSIYDSAGRLQQRTDARGVVSQFGYDALNRLTGITYPAHPAVDVSYVYDEAFPVGGCPANFNIGHLTTMTDASGSSKYCYSNQGDLREVRQSVLGNNGTYLTGIARTPGRRVKYLQYPTGFELLYGYDGAGRIGSISEAHMLGPTDSTFRSLVSNVTYRPFGPTASYSWQSYTLTRTFDANDNVTAITSPALNLIFHRDSRQDINQYLVAPGTIHASCIGPQPEVVPPVGSNVVVETYSYDALDRLQAVYDACSNSEDAYTYNGTGDRLSKQLGGGTPTNYGYLLGTHQLNQVGTAQWQLDAAGNTTALTAADGTALGLTYDDRGLLTSLSRNGTSAAAYDYNGKGERTWRSVTLPTPTTVATLYDPEGTGNLFGEYTPTSLREYVYLNGIPVAAAFNAGSSGAGIYLLYADQLGTVRAATTQATNSTQYAWNWVNNPFGEQAATGGLGLSMRFPGQYYDAESGLNYNGHRYYSPNVGRYLQSDPIGLEGGISTYDYVGNNSLSFIDQFGLQEECESAVNAAACAAAGMGGNTAAGAGSGTAVGGEAGAATGNAVGGTVLGGIATPDSDNKPCPDGDCAAIIAQINSHLDLMEEVYDDMLIDEHNLFTTAFDKNLPGEAANWGTWAGHIRRYNGLRVGLGRLIAKAIALGCPVPPRAYRLLNLPPPTSPAGY